MTVEVKLCTTGTLIPVGPNHGPLVLLVECAPHINKDKPPVLLLGMLGPEEAYHVYPTLNTCFHPSHQIFSSTHRLFLLNRNTRDVLQHEVAPGLSHSDRPDPWLLVQCDNPTSHKRTVVSPWGTPAFKTLYEVRDGQSHLPACITKS